MVDDATALRVAIHQALFSDPTLSVYAILDGASVNGLLDQLEAHHPEHCCLFSGELDEELAQTAPYLVLLESSSPFTEWVLSGFGKHWGIFAIAREPMRAVRRHLRTFLRVQDPDGKWLFFRYYDPRVLRVYIPTLNETDTRPVFGPVHFYACESKTENELLVYRRKDDLPHIQRVALAPTRT